jgi:hypothetical protein
MAEKFSIAALLPFALMAAIAMCPGCFKPGAQVEAERMATHINAESGCTFALRQWFTAVASGLTIGHLWPGGGEPERSASRI